MLNITASSILFCLLRFTEPVQVFKNKRTVCRDASQRRATVHLWAVRASIQSLFPNAVMYWTELIAERRFCTVNAAAGAVNHFRRNCYSITVLSVLVLRQQLFLLLSEASSSRSEHLSFFRSALRLSVSLYTDYLLSSFFPDMQGIITILFSA